MVLQLLKQIQGDITGKQSNVALFLNDFNNFNSKIIDSTREFQAFTNTVQALKWLGRILLIVCIMLEHRTLLKVKRLFRESRSRTAYGRYSAFSISNSFTSFSGVKRMDSVTRITRTT
jgi:hypothetical protein